MDLLVANTRGGFGPGTPGIRLLINNGKGVFADATSRLPSQAFDTQEVLAGDVDGDGRVDLVAFDADRLRLYLQDKAGKFAAANGNVPGTITSIRSGAVGDTDGDGDLDILIGTQTGLAYLLNDGKGKFVLALPVFLPKIVAWIGDMQLVELTGDQYPELLFATESGGASTWLLRNNRGGFSDMSAALSNRPFAFSHGVGDLDSDGDVDIVIPTNSGLRLLFNLQRQLHASLPPAVNGRYVVDLYWRFKTAANNHAAILALSPKARAINLPPLGVLGIDTSLMVLLPARKLPGSSGMLEYAFPAANDSRLKGLAVHAQAIMATPAGIKLTNSTKSVVR